MMNKPIANQRLDKWLWYARFVKTRTLASRLIEAGKIRINSTRVNKPSTTVKVGDIVTAMIARHLYVLEVLDGGARRGPADEAKGLYKLIETTRPETGKRKGGDDQDKASVEAPPPLRLPGSGRPTKRERRQMDRFRSNSSN